MLAGDRFSLFDPLQSPAVQSGYPRADYIEPATELPAEGAQVWFAAQPDEVGVRRDDLDVLDIGLVGEQLQQLPEHRPVNALGIATFIVARG